MAGFVPDDVPNIISDDCPVVESQPGADQTEQISLCREDREKILIGDVRRLLKLQGAIVRLIARKGCFFTTPLPPARRKAAP